MSIQKDDQTLGNFHFEEFHVYKYALKWTSSNVHTSTKKIKNTKQQVLSC